MSALIISAYPCCGKSYATKYLQNRWKISDSDSSKFSWIERKRTEEELEEIKRQWDEEGHLLGGEGYINQIKNNIIKVRNPNFIDDYMKYIEEVSKTNDIVFVSSHLEVRQALTDRGFKFVTIYPDSSIPVRNEWIGRMYSRGSNKNFIDDQLNNWEERIKSIENEPHGSYILTLHNGQYIDESILSMLMDDHKWPD